MHTSAFSVASGDLLKTVKMLKNEKGANSNATCRNSWTTTREATSRRLSHIASMKMSSRHSAATATVFPMDEFDR